MVASGWQPLVSVIVPTYNREAVLCQTLATLFEQDYPNYEIIVVDQTPQHRDETYRFLEENKQKLRHIKVDKPSLPRARNIGLRHARGELVLFLDDDIIPVRDLVSKHVRGYADDNAVCGVAGQVVPPEGGLVDEGKVGRIDERARLTWNFNSTVAADTMWGPGGNSSFRRKLVEAAGLYEPAFAGTSVAEELDLCVRLYRLGYHMKFEPGASILHLAVSDGGCENRHIGAWWYYWYAHNMALLALRHRSLLNMLLVPPTQARALIRMKGGLRGLPLLAIWLPAQFHALVSYFRSRSSLKGIPSGVRSRGREKRPLQASKSERPNSDK
ncbi:MAG TPA: glycosyltransferase [Chloroflexia bacterium]|nr:glycosyltransferase [Chloroflexia bacterium]